MRVDYKEIGASVEIDQTGVQMVGRNLTLLALICWYTIILMSYDEYYAVICGTTAAVTASVSAASH